MSFLNGNLGKVKIKIMQESKKGVIDWSLKKCNDVEMLYKNG